MMRHPFSLAFIVLLGLACAVFPPACGDEASPAEPTTQPGSPETPTSNPLIIWDGDTAAKGKGWVAPKKGNNKFGPSETTYKGKKSLEFRGAGSGWIGCAWNWFGWWPKTASSDLSGYTSMRFNLRVTGESVPKELTIYLTSNTKDKARSVALPISKYVVAQAEAKDPAEAEKSPKDKVKPKFNDGQWHEIVIPMKDFVPSKKTPTFDTKAIWEFHISQWSSAARDFTANFDSIRFE